MIKNASMFSGEEILLVFKLKDTLKYLGIPAVIHDGHSPESYN